MCTAGSRYYSQPVGITDSTALGGPSCMEENQGKAFPTGHPPALLGLSEGEGGKVAPVWDFLGRLLPVHGGSDQTSPSVASLVKRNIRGIVHRPQPDAEIEARFGISI